MGGNNFPGDVELDVFVNMGQEVENQIQQGEEEEGQIPAPVVAVQLVYECCEKIRLQGLHPHPDIKRISGDLLRLEDTNNDFKLYMLRVDKRALDLLERLDDVFQLPSNINLTPYEPNLRAQLVEEAWEVITEFHVKLRPRLQRIKYMYKYHIRSIQELQLRKATGELESDVFSQIKFNYLSDQLTGLRLTPGSNQLETIPIAFLIKGITSYLIHHHATKKKDDPATNNNKTPLQKCNAQYGNTTFFLGLFYFVCTVVITAVVFLKNTRFFVHE